MKKENIILLVVTVILVGIFIYSLFFSTPKYTVTFDTDGGTKIESVEVKKYDTVSKPEDPTKESYTFKGWTVDGAEYKFDTGITKDTKITANWEEIVTTTTKKAKKHR